MPRLVYFADQTQGRASRSAGENGSAQVIEREGIGHSIGAKPEHQGHRHATTAHQAVHGEVVHLRAMQRGHLAEIRAMRDREQQLRSDQQLSNARIAELECQVRALVGERDSLRHHRDELLDDRRNLFHEAEAHLGEIDQLRTSIDELQRENESYRTAVDVFNRSLRARMRATFRQVRGRR